MSNALNAYLKASSLIVRAKSDMDRLRFMPQKIVGGMFIDFKGNDLYPNTNGVQDLVIFDADAVNNATRCTAALLNKYFTALDEVMLNNDSDDTALDEVMLNNDSDDTAEGRKQDPLYVGIIKAIGAGDKKAVRDFCKELKEKWFALDSEMVEDAIDDLKDCVADKDVNEAGAIIAELTDDDVGVTAKEEPVKTEASKDDNKTTELIADLEDAVKDEDFEDVELLLKDLDKAHPRYDEFAGTLKKDEALLEDSDEMSDQEIDELIEDIEAAIKDGDLDGEKDGAKVMLKELVAEVGEKDEDVVKLTALVYPPVEEKELSRAEKRALRKKEGK